MDIRLYVSQSKFISLVDFKERGNYSLCELYKNAVEVEKDIIFIYKSKT